MSTTDEHPATHAKQQAEHGPATGVRELPEAPAAPQLGVHAQLRNAEGLLLILDRGTKGECDLPGGPAGNELPAAALARQLLPLYEKLDFDPAAHYLTLRRPLAAAAARPAAAGGAA
ncbi:hypothetical protein ACIHEI_34665 [Kitasatospora sp. NPDC051984]|uniref:hypothetical protein n=1 Tax=Kitasatospora sp. NPDC051984 TaxID=3364059 RepID=UPI0037CA173B